MVKNIKKEAIERVVIKIPKVVADYFRKSFPHGKRSEFVADCILEHMRRQEIENMEEKLRLVNKKRQ